MFRIATWNLERPRRGSHRKTAQLLDRIATIDAAVWILTETNAVIDLSATHVAMASTPVEGLHSPGENWTTIWSRYPARPVPTCDPDIAVCADVDSPIGPLVVYGTVLPYHADRGPTGDATTWSEHYRVTALQGADWRRLRAAYPEHGFCVAGDLNQSRDGRRWNGRQWYGTSRGRDLLSAELHEVGMVCATEEDLVAAGKLETRSTIDHVCLDAASCSRVRRVGAWEPGRGDGVRLSDHNGV